MNYSIVEVREENILALRSFLLEGPEAWAPLAEQIQVDDETAAGYMSLLYGAFCVAVRRRFSPTYTVGEIVRLVADMRIKAEDDAGLINAFVAEDMIRRVVGAPPLQDGGTDDVRTVLYAEVCILLYLVGEADFDRAGLEQFIDEATAYTEQWLAARQREQAGQGQTAAAPTASAHPEESAAHTGEVT
ncbi:hypothetical protein [Actinomadura bangladeshensis]|uniref:Uncharacterized protein n=1 Tax=Actinomadura bangladeshensis TaxID=453573 RepID=A0A4R4NAB0_9ACTN|nr:hypothetical protein [Actinomadura bangladeshensis]TDC05825.1 hypothetical protein E1284_34820 [Actinomadura bangladeshensis]